MDFIDSLKQLSSRISIIKEQISTEEATKMSLIVPFFQVLGYDVFNPSEFMPEFTADVGIKKGEKVDYAILENGEPVILIEAKSCSENLDEHSSQLFRYFGTTSAKFGILTNGVIYRFYTDLDELNKMDLSPFMELNMLDVKEDMIPEIKKFRKDQFDVDDVFSTASELKYSKLIKEFMATQLKQPTDEFVKHILATVYPGVRTQSIIEKFKPIIKKALNEFISETMNDKISAALKKNVEEDSPINEETEVEANGENDDKKTREPTEVELEAFMIVRVLVGENIANDDVTYRTAKDYINVLYKDNGRKWICRLRLGFEKEYLYLPDENKNMIKIPLINGVDDLYQHREALLQVLDRYL